MLELDGRLSTAAAGLRLPPLGASCRVERITLADGGTVQLTWAAAPARARALVLLLPGLGNTSHWGFIRQSMAYLRERGLQAVCIDHRGYAGVPLTSPRVGCADSWRDLPEVFSHMTASIPGLPLVAIGFSMGGQMLAKYLSETRLGGPMAGTRLAAAITVSSPYDISASMRRLETGMRVPACGAMCPPATDPPSTPHASAGLHARTVNALTTSLAKLQIISHFASPSAREHFRAAGIGAGKVPASRSPSRAARLTLPASR